MTAPETTARHTHVYRDSYQHLCDELRKLDLLLQLKIQSLRSRARAMEKTISSRQLYIADEEVDWLLRSAESRSGNNGESSTHKELEQLQNRINAGVTASLEQGIPLTLPSLAHLFGLSPFEVQVMVICLAPELDRKYDRLYAYVQDDVTRKKPSLDLALDLLFENKADQWRARTMLGDHGPLFHHGIIQKSDDPQSPSGSSGLAQFMKLNPRILHYLLGNNSIDARLQGIAKLLRPLPSLTPVFIDSATKAKLLRLVEHHFSVKTPERKRLFVYLHGPYGVGKRDLALGICGHMNTPMLYIDAELLAAEDPGMEQALRAMFHEGLLLQAPLYLDQVDILLKEDDVSKARMKRLLALAAEYGRLIFFAGEKPWPYRRMVDGAAFHAVELSVPEPSLRKAAWEECLKIFLPESEQTWAEPLAVQFRLTPGQIRDAVHSAGKHRSQLGEEAKLGVDELYAACRNESNQKLRELAIKIEPRYDWADIILPDDTTAQLREICSQAQNHHRIFGEWGFGKKLQHGKGLSVLFSGPPGTGKTMAADVIAGELHVDLYKLDLSSLVSKYIGETEKNLAKIFNEAQTGNAILFFDEADALFGKRTEVSDAHDRYANIETSYLLQKMEEYEGIVILATNIRENMDEAFTRRIRFIVEFPFPDEASRKKIWKRHFPAEAPVSEEIDYELLSRNVPVAGGSIKNIVLNAAFLAVKNGGVIDMKHILHGARREFEKIGKLWDAAGLMAQKEKTLSSGR